MKRVGAYMILFLMCNMVGLAQSEKKLIREGNRNFEDKQFEESEVLYRKAINEEAGSFDANFNLGDALYKQEKFDEAAGEFNGLVNRIESNKELAKTYHNLGNSLLKSQKIEQSITAYKSSLRYYPDDQETKYNLAYAKDLLKKQQKKNQEKDQDQKQDKDQEKKEQDKKEQENQEQKKNDQQQDKQKQQQSQPQKISKEDANRLLKALANDEKKIQEKVKKAKAKMQKVKTEKDW